MAPRQRRGLDEPSFDVPLGDPTWSQAADGHRWSRFSNSRINATSTKFHATQTKEEHSHVGHVGDFQEDVDMDMGITAQLADLDRMSPARLLVFVARMTAERLQPDVGNISDMLLLVRGWPKLVYLHNLMWESENQGRGGPRRPVGRGSGSSLSESPLDDLSLTTHPLWFLASPCRRQAHTVRVGGLLYNEHWSGGLLRRSTLAELAAGADRQR